MDKLEALTRIHDQSYVLAASEGFASGYKKTPEQFKALMLTEAKMHRKVRSYLKNLASKAPTWVNWESYNTHLAIKKAADDITIDFSDDEFTGESDLIATLLFDDFADATSYGAAAAQTLSKGSITLSKQSSAIQQSARTQAAKLVTEVTPTTRQRIHDALNTSLQLGENQLDAASRLSDILDDPARALMIAQTESVDSWNQGTLAYGNETGAVSKTWEALPSAEDELCTGNDGQTVDISDTFDSGDDGPPAHPNCRCVMYLNYPDGSESEDDSSE